VTRGGKKAFSVQIGGTLKGHNGPVKGQPNNLLVETNFANHPPPGETEKTGFWYAQTLVKGEGKNPPSSRTRKARRKNGKYPNQKKITGGTSIGGT